MKKLNLLIIQKMLKQPPKKKLKLLKLKRPYYKQKYQKKKHSQLLKTGIKELCKQGELKKIQNLNSKGLLELELDMSYLDVHRKKLRKLKNI